ncbi:hypothetical protein U1Q18_013411, partial [Sarracenia purpurea var. burkii]
PQPGCVCKPTQQCDNLSNLEWQGTSSPVMLEQPGEAAQLMGPPLTPTYHSNTAHITYCSPYPNCRRPNPCYGRRGQTCICLEENQHKESGPKP